VFALFAGVQGEPTLGTISDGIGQVLQESSALGATRDGAGSGHVERTGSESIFSFCGGWFFEFFLRLAGGILVSALPILAVRQRVPPEKLPHSALLARLAQVALSWGLGRTNGYPYMAMFGSFESCGSCLGADLLWFRSQSSNPLVDTAL